MWQVIGQERAIKLIERALRNDLIAHGYLFTGSEHIGKMTLSRNMAQALNCCSEDPPCGSCSSCLKITSGIHPDVSIISLPEDGRSEKAEIGIDRIREACHSANLLPYEGKYRVFIIDKAESLSLEASNALLKTLEEPPPRVIFILLSSEPSRLLPTIVSRCQVISLRPVPAGEVEQFLIQTYKFSPERSRLIAWLSRGRVGWAASAAEDESTVVSYEERLKSLVDIINNDEERRLNHAAEMTGKFARNRREVYQTLDEWLDFLRDLLLIKIGLSELIINVDFKAVLGALSTQVDLPDIIGGMKSIDGAGVDLKHNVSSRLVLDNLLLSLPNRRQNDD